MKKAKWKTVEEFEDITYKKSGGVARIAFNRPEVRNAFRPKTTTELYKAFYNAQEDTSFQNGLRLQSLGKYLFVLFLNIKIYFLRF